VDGGGEVGVFRRIKSHAEPTQRLPATGQATANWPAPTARAGRGRSPRARLAAVLAAIATVVVGAIVALDSGGSQSPSGADGAKRSVTPSLSVPRSGDPATQARELADFLRAQAR
jgi:hypothetical protein